MLIIIIVVIILIMCNSRLCKQRRLVFVFGAKFFFQAMGKNRCGSTKKVLRKLKEKTAVGTYATWIQLRIFCIACLSKNDNLQSELVLSILLFIFCSSSKSKASKSNLAQAARSSSARAASSSSAQAASSKSAQAASPSSALAARSSSGRAADSSSAQVAGKSSSAQTAKSSSAQAEQKKDSGGKPPPLYKPGESVLQWWASWFASATEPQLSLKGKKRPAWFRAEVTVAAVWKPAGTYAGQTIEPGWWYNAH
jgi:hypothetical protein